MIEQILGRLQKVKKTGKSKWLACCPAHGDKSPSLSIMQNETGKVFVHCFAGCAGDSVMASIGMTLSDLYPDTIEPPKGVGKKPAVSPYDLLKIIRDETRLVAIMGSEMQTYPLTKSEHDRLYLAVQRINNALKIGGAHG